MCRPPTPIRRRSSLALRLLELRPPVASQVISWDVSRNLLAHRNRFCAMADHRLPSVILSDQMERTRAETTFLHTRDIVLPVALAFSDIEWPPRKRDVSSSCVSTPIQEKAVSSHGAGISSTVTAAARKAPAANTQSSVRKSQKISTLISTQESQTMLLRLQFRLTFSVCSITRQRVPREF